MDYEFIECIEIKPSIRRILLNRPNKRNALCNPLRKELFSCLETFDSDPEVKAIIISGKGSCFCAGYDLVKIFHTILVRQMAFGLVMS